MFQRLICTMCTAAGLWFAGPAVAEEVLLGLGYDRTRDGHGFDLHKLGDT